MDPIDAFYERYNRGDLEAAMSLFCDDAVLANTVLGQKQDQPNQVQGITWHVLLVITGSVLTIVPLVVAFLLLERFWQSGLSAGSVK